MSIHQKISRADPPASKNVVKCVYTLTLMYKGARITIGIHVDDILVTCALEDGLNREVKMVRGNEH